MIVSASRRTDIPALYADWFFQRLGAGWAEVPNPFNPRQSRRVSLSPGEVDGFVFWSKNPAPMLDRLARLEAYPYYFQYTLNAYGADIEPGVPPLVDRIDTLLRLADRVGPARVTWRYDPILINQDWTPDRHELCFGQIADQAAGQVEGVVFSFLDRYRKNEAALRRLGCREWTCDEMRGMAARLAAIARARGLRLSTCAEPVDLSAFGIGHARCVDGMRLTGHPVARDPHQRPACGCSASVDIGMYHSCTQGCAYCYANNSRAAALRAHQRHDPSDSRLIRGDAETANARA